MLEKYVIYINYMKSEDCKSKCTTLSKSAKNPFWKGESISLSIYINLYTGGI